jgi:hypothetical protein
VKERALIIFVKAPLPGKVKTRLARELGDEAACRLYRNMARDIAEKLGRDDSWETIIAFSPPEEEGLVRDWLGPGFSYHPQKGDDLGERMFRAIADALESGYGRVVLVGSDIPEITAEIILRAFESLEGVDIVLGPARDGGYYLVGMKRPYRDIFTGIPWSTPEVMAATCGRIREAGLTTAFIEPLSDVDDPEDLETHFRKTLKDLDG